MTLEELERRMIRAAESSRTVDELWDAFCAIAAEPLQSPHVDEGEHVLVTDDVRMSLEHLSDFEAQDGVGRNDELPAFELTREAVWQPRDAQEQSWYYGVTLTAVFDHSASLARLGEREVLGQGPSAPGGDLSRLPWPEWRREVLSSGVLEALRAAGAWIRLYCHAGQG